MARGLLLQFKHLAPALAAQGHEVVALTLQMGAILIENWNLRLGLRK
jgi:hypothetical protein